MLEDIVQFKWFEDCIHALQAPIGHEDVKRVLFSMDSGKAPGPNGFSVGFFKCAWNVVGENL